MLCPKCGSSISDYSSKCPECGLALQNPHNNLDTRFIPKLGEDTLPVGNNVSKVSVNDAEQQISADIEDNELPIGDQVEQVSIQSVMPEVPDDFKLASGYDINDSGINDYENRKVKKRKVPKNVELSEERVRRSPPKRKKTRKIIIKVLKIIIFVALLLGSYIAILYFNEPKFVIKCSGNQVENGIIREYEEIFTKSKHGHYNAYVTLTIRRDNYMPLVLDDLSKEVTRETERIENREYDMGARLDEGVLIITYFLSYNDIRYPNQIKALKVSQGFSCEDINKRINVY